MIHIFIWLQNINRTFSYFTTWVAVTPTAALLSSQLIMNSASCQLSLIIYWPQFKPHCRKRPPTFLPSSLDLNFKQRASWIPCPVRLSVISFLWSSRQSQVTSTAQAHKLVHWLLHLHITLLVVFWFVLHYLSFLITKHDFWEPYMIVISIKTSTMHIK